MQENVQGEIETLQFFDTRNMKCLLKKAPCTNGSQLVREKGKLKGHRSNTKKPNELYRVAPGVNARH